MTHRGPRGRVQLAVQNLGHKVIGNPQQILICGRLLPRPASRLAHTSSHVTPSIWLMTRSCTGTIPISISFVPAAMSVAFNDAVGKPNSAIAASRRCPFSTVGRTRMSRSPVNLGAPWNASAWAPTMTNSTACAVSNAQNSSKSGSRSKILPPQELDRGDPLSGGTAPPVDESALRSRLLGKRRDPQDPSVHPKIHHSILCEVFASAAAQEILFLLCRPLDRSGYSRGTGFSRDTPGRWCRWARRSATRSGGVMRSSLAMRWISPSSAVEIASSVADTSNRHCIRASF